MFGTRMICGFYNFTKNKICSCYGFIKDLPNLYRTKANELRNYLIDFRYKLNNLAQTNHGLGLYHLYLQNLNDAIIRFKLIDKFLKPGDEKANYLLGWCYFLKNNEKKALHHLNKAKTEDKANLGMFIENYTNYTEIPNQIWTDYRDFIAGKYITKFYNDKINFPYIFVQEVFKNITELPDHYSILDLGANIGLAGYEINRRFPDSFTLIGVENSEKMLTLIDAYYPDAPIYDQLVYSSIKDFLSTTTDKFDVIFSFCGLIFTKDLMNYLKPIHDSLNDKGYFAFCLPTSKTTAFSFKRKEFVYNTNEVKDLISTSNIFTLLHFNELMLDITNSYSIFICRKM